MSTTMSKRRQMKRRRAAVELGFELCWLFCLGFITSSLIGIALAWAVGLGGKDHSHLDDVPEGGGP
jgi:hypothetical protein